MAQVQITPPGTRTLPPEGDQRFLIQAAERVSGQYGPQLHLKLTHIPHSGERSQFQQWLKLPKTPALTANHPVAQLLASVHDLDEVPVGNPITNSWDDEKDPIGHEVIGVVEYYTKEKGKNAGAQDWRFAGFKRIPPTVITPADVESLKTAFVALYSDVTDPAERAKKAQADIVKAIGQPKLTKNLSPNEADKVWLLIETKAEAVGKAIARPGAKPAQELAAPDEM